VLSLFKYHFRFWLIACLSFSCAAQTPALTQTYVVQNGDSLWEIAEQFSMSVAELKQLNRLNSNRIYPGQTLRIRSSFVDDEYVVKRGDTLSEIAEQFSIGLTELKRMNGLTSNRIRVGQKLKLRMHVEELVTENGPYYFYSPKAAAQQSKGYREAPSKKPIEDYRNARNLMRVFNADIDARIRQYGRGKSQPLKGWRIVLDPGHGGRDPGAIVSNVDGVNRSVHVVEDEYVYDIALRLYRKLRFSGAAVEMTVISPNHLIRNNEPATVTFVHEQNEVYNDDNANRKNSFSVRPALSNITQRVKIANRFFKGGKRTLFVSLHADNSPNRPKGPLVIYLNQKGKINTQSRAFAQVMQKALHHPGLSAQIAGRNLAVLRGNQAQAEILVEIRNVHDKGEAWALRFHDKRDPDAERIFSGILNYVKAR
jgi:N-acetylmuramoyl-L-alanine amidase